MHLETVDWAWECCYKLIIFYHLLQPLAYLKQVSDDLFCFVSSAKKARYFNEPLISSFMPQLRFRRVDQHYIQGGNVFHPTAGTEMALPWVQHRHRGSPYGQWPGIPSALPSPLQMGSVVLSYFWLSLFIIKRPQITRLYLGNFHQG